MTEISIDSGVPMPSRTKYPWNDMSVGDSFFVAGEDTAKMGRSLTTSATCWGHRNYPIKLSVRQTEENGTTGIRCWRIA